MKKSTNKLRVKLGLFGAVPITLCQDKRVKPNGIRLYVALSSFEGTSDESFPSYAKLAERSGLSLRAVASALKNLTNTGHIQRTRRGLGRTNLYRCLAYMEAADSDSLMREKIAHQDGRKNNTIDARKNRASYEKPTLKEGVDNGRTRSKERKRPPVKGAIKNISLKHTPSSPPSFPLPTTPVPIAKKRQRRREGNDKINIAIARKLGATADDIQYIEYFLIAFQATQHHEHPAYNERTMKDCLERLRDNVAAWDFDVFARMVNRYFETPFDNSDYHFAHFTSGDIPYHRMMETECTDDYDFQWTREAI